MKKIFYRTIAMVLITVLGNSNVISQNKEQNAKKDSVKTLKAGTTANVMLNASSDSGPRSVNIGLPKSVGGTAILENGLPVTLDFRGLIPTAIWRPDAGVSKIRVLNVSQTAVLAGEIGVSISTYNNRGTDKFRGSATFSTNSFGLLRGDVGISGPLKNGFQYSLTAFVNMDPGTYRSNITTFTDKTQIYKAVLNKKYRNGQIGVQYKFAYSEGLKSNQSPYIYRPNGKVDALPGFRIGRDAYVEQSGELHVIDPLTGKADVWDVEKDASSTAHVIDIFGDHKFNNGMILDYTLRYNYINAGMFNPYLMAISKNGIKKNKEGKDIYPFYYANNVDDYASGKLSPYKGEYVQSAMMIANPNTEKNALLARIELSKKTKNHHWMVGFHNWYYNVDKSNSATYIYMFEVAPNPKALVYRGSDKYGNLDYNSAVQYYNGVENKMALVATEKWKLNRKLEIDLGTRLEWQRLDGDRYSNEDRAAAPDKTWISGKTTDVKKNWFNLSFTANAMYKAFKNAGVLGEFMYLQQSGTLNAYAGGDNPNIKKCVIPGVSLGVYYNHPKFSVVSKITRIKRTNFKNNSTFPATWTDEKFPGEEFSKSVTQTSSYDVNTIGWTTDVLISPFKGFDLHLLLTMQNPKYENYELTINYEKESKVTGGISTHQVHVNNNGNVPRSVSKTIIEIDPSYRFGKFRIWASARYYSKEFANYTNTLSFAGRWETFAGLNYKYDKNIDFSVSAVNLLNQSGAKGTISGTNTTTAEQAVAKYHNKPVCGTYIRPFTLEFKAKIKF